MYWKTSALKVVLHSRFGKSICVCLVYYVDLVLQESTQEEGKMRRKQACSSTKSNLAVLAIGLIGIALAGYGIVATITKSQNDVVVVRPGDSGNRVDTSFSFELSPYDLAGFIGTSTEPKEVAYLLFINNSSQLRQIQVVHVRMSGIWKWSKRLHFSDNGLSGPKGLAVKWDNVGSPLQSVLENKASAAPCPTVLTLVYDVAKKTYGQLSTNVYHTSVCTIRLPTDALTLSVQ